MITAQWAGVSARQEIYSFVDHLNDGLGVRNRLDKDFVLKLCLVLCDLDQRYKISNFTNNNLNRIESEWSRIKTSLEATLRLVNRFGIDAETLTSLNALLTIAYYIHKTASGSLDGTTPFEAANAKRIQRWLLGSLLNGVFGGSSDRTIGQARTILQDNLNRGRDFPERALVQGFIGRGRTVSFDDGNIDGVLATSYGKRICFLALSLLYDTHAWGVTPHHIDHIIPRSLADRKKLAERNVPESAVERIQSSVNRLGNLQLLLARENLEKSNMPFDEWLKTRDAAFRERHLIPNDSMLWKVEALPEFVAAREELIRQRIRQLDIEQAASELDVSSLPVGICGAI